jgi:hypothetical protein
MPLYGTGMGFALLFITFVMCFTQKKQRPLKTAAWMVSVTVAFPCLSVQLIKIMHFLQ